MAELQFKREHCMTPREMRAYWDELHTPLWGPCHLSSQRIEMRSKKPTRVTAGPAVDYKIGRGFTNQTFTELENGFILVTPA